MSVSNCQAEAALKLTLVCGLLGLGAAVTAAETELPDLAFLEYLGSWEESDEDWVLFSEEDIEKASSENIGKETDPAPREAKVAEVDDEN
jgi:hypothetical protein